MNYKVLRQVIRDQTDSDTDIVQILNVLGREGDSDESREKI